MLSELRTVVDPASEPVREAAEATAPHHQLRNLIVSQAHVAPTVPLNNVVDFFASNTDKDSVAVIDTGNVFLGLIQKGQLMGHVGSKYGYALYERRPITLLIDTEAVVLPGTTAIPRVVERVVNRASQRVYDDIAVVGPGRQFEGIVSVKDLILHQSREISEQLEVIQKKDQLISDVMNRNQELALASRMKTEFLTNMSHELRTPLVSIIGFTDLVRSQSEGMLPGIHLANLDRVLSSSRDLLDLINNLLDLSKVEAGRMNIEVEPVRLNELVGELTERLSVLAADRDLELRSAVPENLELMTDRVKLRQVLLNLMSNAVKFTEKGSISVEVDEDGPYVAIDVIDTGIGIRKEDLSRLLQRFEQLDTGRTKRFQGSGLGLAISRELAQLLGGDITVDSEFGQGSRFRVTVLKQLDPAAMQRPHGLSTN